MPRNTPEKVETKTRVHVGAKTEFLDVYHALQILEALVFCIYYGLDTRTLAILLGIGHIVPKNIKAPWYFVSRLRKVITDLSEL